MARFAAAWPQPAQAHLCPAAVPEGFCPEGIRPSYCVTDVPGQFVTDVLGSYKLLLAATVMPGDILPQSNENYYYSK